MTSETSSIICNFLPRIAWADTSSTGISTRLNPVAQSIVCNFPIRIAPWHTSSTGGLLSSTNLVSPHSSLYYHFLQTRLAGSCAAELQAHTVFRK